MQDQYGREIDYVRISITDRCNLRCTYCMPEEGIENYTSHTEILSYEEILRLVRCLAKLGIGKIKLTGGEPLVRLGCCDLVRQLKAIDGIEQVTITTNGVLLEELAGGLIEAGIDGINVSLDTVERDIFQQITRRDYFDSVMAGIEQVKALRYQNLKINCVPIAQFNKKELVKLAAQARDYPMAVRFIELMPIGLAQAYTAVSKEEIMDMLTEAFGPMTPYAGTLGNGPAEYYSLPDFKGHIGFIGAIHNKFCGQCNRIRLTSNGFLKLCLNQNKGGDLLPLIRGNASDEELTEVMRNIIYQKPAAHHFYEDDQQDTDSRQMYQVGG
ncbi:MAG: GTP 3',8-cyclase MoaA [Peptococcaceae bacterium]|nr:GTP 3',8-cyclase MoaA [Peptococcaceae bacterium]